jgi:DHA1 family tetracycline resistance protein-like MFS transporter
MKRGASINYIFITVVLDVLSLGIVIPVLPKLVEAFLGGDTGRAAQFYGLFGTAWAGMQFIFSPLLGTLSDRFGRRPVILLSNFGLGFDYILMALAPTVWWLFLGRIFSGICGASWTTAAAYVADITEPEKRAGAFGRIGAAWGLGFVLGPALGGVLGGIDLRLPFWVAAGLTLANAAYGMFVLPESLPVERRTHGVDLKRANPLGALGLVRAHHGLTALVSVTFLYWFAHQALTSVFVLYTGHRYGWTATTVGLTLALVGVCNVIVQAGLVRTIVRRFGERRTLLAGLLCGAAGFIAYGLAPSPPWFWAAVPIFALMGLQGPAMQSLMTRRVGPSEQGRLQGINGSLQGITGMVGPPFFAGIFAWVLGPGIALRMPGAPFVVAGGALVLAAFIAERATRVAVGVTTGAS